jgi:predicted transporter
MSKVNPDRLAGGEEMIGGVLIGLGIGRVWIHRRQAAAVFVAGALVSIGGFILLSSLKDLHPTSITLWEVMLAYSLGMSWILGRLLSGIVRRDGGSRVRARRT